MTHKDIAERNRRWADMFASGKTMRQVAREVGHPWGTVKDGIQRAGGGRLETAKRYRAALERIATGEVNARDIAEAALRR